MGVPLFLFPSGPNSDPQTWSSPVSLDVLWVFDRGPMAHNDIPYGIVDWSKERWKKWKKKKCVDSFEIESYVSIDGLLEFRVQHRTDWLTVTKRKGPQSVCISYGQHCMEENAKRLRSVGSDLQLLLMSVQIDLRSNKVCQNNYYE